MREIPFLLDSLAAAHELRNSVCMILLILMFLLLFISFIYLLQVAIRAGTRHTYAFILHLLLEDYFITFFFH